MSSSRRSLRVVAASPLDEDLADLIRHREPRVDFVLDSSLLHPQRFPGDHTGDPSYVRSDKQTQAFYDLLASADALYGVPDEQPALLRWVADQNTGLRWVQTMPAGGGAQVKAAGLTEPQLASIAFTTSAGVHGEPLAEFAVFGILAGAKSLPRLLAQQAERRWSERWAMGLLAEQRVLVLGLGGIGAATARKLSRLNVYVIGTSRRGIPVEGVDEVIHPDDIVKVAPSLDGVIVTLPGTSATHHLLDQRFFDALKPGATLVSVGRGTVIDEPALVDALDHGRIGFAALDVFAVEPLPPESTLWGDPRVLVSPHTAALNAAEDRLIAELFAENASRFLDGRQLLNRVDTVEFY